MQEHLLSCWKAAAQQSGSPQHKHHIPRACKSAIFFGIHSLTTTTSLVQGSSTEKRKAVIHLDLLSRTDRLADGSALPWVWQQLLCPFRSWANSENSVPGAQHNKPSNSQIREVTFPGKLAFMLARPLAIFNPYTSEVNPASGSINLHISSLM